MDALDTPLDLVRRHAPDRPVACARPARLLTSARWLQDRFPGKVHYAVKANPSPWVITALGEAGIAAFDVASEAEIELVAGLLPEAELAFMHPVKSRRAIGRAHGEFGCRTFALDCAAELDKIAAETGGADDVTLIVRLAVENSGAAMPLAGKFGASVFDAPELLRLAREKAARLGVTFHVGSQCMEPESYAAAMEAASRVIARAGTTVDIVNVGGGFPAVYPGMVPPPLEDYLAAIARGFEAMMVHGNAELWCEPGRALVAECLSIVARVELRKGDALYLNDGAFGNLFDAAHMRWPYPTRLLRTDGRDAGDVDEAAFRLFGPTCDSMDAMPGPFLLPADAREGDHVEIGMLGAYGATMSTRFNGFGLSDLVVVKDWPWPSLYDGLPLPRDASRKGATGGLRRRGRGPAEAAARP